MNQNRLYLVVGVLLAAVIAMGFYIWQEQQKPDGVEIRIGEQGISVEGK